MKEKRDKLNKDPLGLSRIEVDDPRSLPVFSTGEVAGILGLEIWRLQKFLDSPRYQLLAPEQLGKGKGSRRLFSTEDVYRLGIAAQLVKDGFVAELVGKVVRSLDDRDLLDWDEEGNQVRAGFIALRRTETGRKVEDFPPERPPEIKGDIYYILDVGQLTRDIDGKIQEIAAKKR